VHFARDALEQFPGSVAQRRIHAEQHFFALIERYRIDGYRAAQSIERYMRSDP
jgi:hypothetical protein